MQNKSSNNELFYELIVGLKCRNSSISHNSSQVLLQLRKCWSVLRFLFPAIRHLSEADKPYIQQILNFVNFYDIHKFMYLKQINITFQLVPLQGFSFVSRLPNNVQNRFSMTNLDMVWHLEQII